MTTYSATAPNGTLLTRTSKITDYKAAGFLPKKGGYELLLSRSLAGLRKLTNRGDFVVAEMLWAE